MTGDGQRHIESVVLFMKLACFYRGKVIRLVLIRVDGKVPEGDPRHTGHRIGIGWRKLACLCQNAMMGESDFAFGVDSESAFQF